MRPHTNKKTASARRRSRERVSSADPSGSSRQDLSVHRVPEVAPLILFATDARGVLTLADGKGFGSAGLAVGRSVFDVWRDHPEVVDGFREALAGRPAQVVCHIDSASFQIRLLPTRDAAGEVTGLIGGALDVTGHVRIQDALQASELRYRSLIEALPYGIEELDTTGIITYCNRAYEEMNGYGPGELIGRSVLDLIAEQEEKERLQRLFGELVRQQAEPTLYVGRNRRKDGSVIDVETAWNYKRNLAGEVIGFTAVVTDVTERNRQQSQLHLLAHAVDQITEGIAVVDLAGHLQFLNRAFAEMHGYAPEELLGRHLSVFHTPEQMPAVEAAQEHALRTGRHEGEIWHVRRDGTPFVAYMHTIILYNEAGKPTGIIGTMRDITEQKRAEEALRAQRIFNRQLVQASPTFFVAIDGQGRTLMMNEAMLEALGYSADEVVGKDYLTTFVPKSERASLEKIFRKLTEKNEPVFNTNHVLTADGRQLLVEWHGRPIFKDDGRLDYFFGVGIDITERRKTREEKARLRAQLYQMQKLEAVGQLAGGVAHDFNNLLAVIMGNVSLIKRDPALSPKAREALADIMDAAERGSSLTRQLLTCARGGLQEPTPTDLNRLVRATLPLLQRSAPEGLRFQCRLHPDLPPILADPPRIEQVLMNLGINAIQASRPPATIRVRTTTRTPDRATANRLGLAPARYAVLQVADEGEGIDPAIRRRIFEPFFTTKPMGRGLGLSVTLGIVQSHGGQIFVDSQPGKGTTFSVWLPLADRPSEPVQPQPRAAETPPPPRGSETILVLDDEVGVADTFDRMLTSLGYCVVTHSHPDEALACLRSNGQEVDLFICDVSLTRCDGRELAEQVRREFPHVAILLTVDGEAAPAETDGRKTDEPRFDCVTKPLTILQLAQAVRAALDRANPAHPVSP